LQQLRYYNFIILASNFQNSINMRKKKLTYWILTGVFSAFMLLSAIPDIFMSPDAVTFMLALGYPRYFIPFIGVAKVLGSLAILIPGFPRIKEWAYAGLMFDLIGAAYSNLAIGATIPEIIPILVAVAVGFASYLYHHKILRASSTADAVIA
jgi:hypothetical protein